MTSFRNLNEYDDIEQVAKAIHFTDRMLFGRLFGDRERSIEAIKHLINSDYVNEYHRNFITVIYDENPNKMEGIVVSYKRNSVNRNSTLKALDETGLTSLSSIVRGRIFSSVFASNLRGADYYIGNLYVFKKYRNRGHGSKLIEKCKQAAAQQNSRRVLVDVEYDRRELIDFYAKLGFTRNTDNFHRFLGKTYGCYGLKYEINNKW